MGNWGKSELDNISKQKIIVILFRDIDLDFDRKAMKKKQLFTSGMSSNILFGIGDGWKGGSLIRTGPIHHRKSEIQIIS